MARFFACRCFATNNIFIKKFKLHVKYHNSDQFLKDYSMILDSLGCKDWERSTLIQEIEVEVSRRIKTRNDSMQRREFIQKNYKPRHSQLYSLQEKYLDQDFLTLVAKANEVTKKEELFPYLTVLSLTKQLYAFPVFTEEFLQKFMEELDHYENFPMEKVRPNSMNRYGIMLQELGLDVGVFDPLRSEYLQPIARILFPDWVGDGLDSHKAFTVQYRIGEDVDLDSHYDNAEVTLNLCLGLNFSGGELYFGDMCDVPLTDSTCILAQQISGVGILHRGQHVHGALPVTDGDRINLIVWTRSSSVRNQLCPMCFQVPDLVPCQYYGDGFTKPSFCHAL